MLQQGKFVADVVYYYGEDNNITGVVGRKLPDIPEGYSYDFINADALVNLLTVENGQLATPSGMRYRLLVLDSNVSENVVAVSQIIVVGKVRCYNRWCNTGIACGRQDGEFEFRRLVKEIWGGEPGSSQPETRYECRAGVR